MGKVIVPAGKFVAVRGAAVTPGGAGARRGSARTRIATITLVAAALAVGLSVTACSPAQAPFGQSGQSGQGGSGGQSGSGGSGGSTPAGQGGQGGEDPGCQAIASQISSISSQLSATSGNYSAQVPVLQDWYGDLQAAQQDASSGVVAGALGDVASGAENIIVDEQNLMDDPNVGFSQLDSDDSTYQSDVSDLETACGFGG
jgi:hypothetical protein